MVVDDPVAPVTSMVGMPVNVDGSNPGARGIAGGKTTPGVIFQSGCPKGLIPGEVGWVGIRGSAWKNPAVDEVESEATEVGSWRATFLGEGVVEAVEAAELTDISMSLWSDPFLEAFLARGFLAEGAAPDVFAVAFFVRLGAAEDEDALISTSVPSSID